MAENIHRLHELSRTLAQRLRQNEEDALGEVFDHFGGYVRARLVQAFGTLLRDEDLDEIVTQALFRLWTYRQKYEPEKSSLASYFFLIARSVAREHLRRRQHRLEPAESLVEAALPATASESVPSAALERLEKALAELPSEDRTILMTFAQQGDEEAWAGELAERWGVPAATIRSRKRRALAQLRERLEQEGMPTMPRHDEQLKMAEKAAYVEFDQYVREHGPEWDKLAWRVQKYLEQPAAERHEQLRGLELQWNEALAGAALDKQQRGQRLQILQNAWRLARAQEAGGAAQRETIKTLLKRLLNAPIGDEAMRDVVQQRAYPDLCRSVEDSLAGIGAALELKRTPQTRRQQKGLVTLEWFDVAPPQRLDATMCWIDKKSDALRLASTAQRTFVTHGHLTGPEAAWFARGVVHEAAHAQPLCIPSFQYTGERDKSGRPTGLAWTRQELPELTHVALPQGMRDGARLEVRPPSDAEQELERRDPELAGALDRALTAAFGRDVKAAERFRDRAGEAVLEISLPSAVTALVDLIQRRTGRPREDVVALFDTAACEAQAHVKDGEECKRRTGALARLWRELTEPGSAPRA